MILIFQSLPVRSISISALAVFLTFGLITQAYTEELIYFEPHTGHTESVDSNNLGRFAKSKEAPHAIISDLTRAGNLTFAVTYADVTAVNGLGFDDATLGATRRATLEAVLTYVNNVLNETTGATIDIEVNVSQTDGSGALASAGTLWFTSPNRFDNGFAFEHITTGTDPFGGAADITITVDFGYTWNSEIDTPSGSEFDLYSVLLHEVTHGLGFSALSTSTGISQISGGNPGVFTSLSDGLTRITGTVDMWNSSFTFVGSSADLISDDLGFAGTNSIAENGGSIPKIYSPASFASGSSLSHWDTSTYPNEIMPHAISVGVQKLTYGALGIAALKDFGYANAAPVKTATVYADFDWTGTERGILSFPVNSFAQSLEMIDTSGTINLDGTATDRESTWTGTINTAMTMDLDPTGSPVSVGAAAADAPMPEPKSGFETRE